MVKNHLKRINAPKTWNIRRKGNKFITIAYPSGHKMELSMPIETILKHILKYAKTRRDVKNILNTKNVLIDGIRKKDIKSPVGLLDTISFREIKTQFRMFINKKGRLVFLEIPPQEIEKKPCKITKKKMHKGRIQLTFHDGRNMLTDNKDYKTNDTLVIDLKNKKILEHLKFEKGMLAYLFGGKYKGRIAKIKDIKEDIVILEDKKQFQTVKRYAYIVGKEKPVIKMIE